MTKKDDFLYYLYEVVQQVGIMSDDGESVGTLEVGERVYALATSLDTTETHDPEWLSTDTDTKVRHERGWSWVKLETNDRDDGHKVNEYMKLLGEVYGSPDEYPSPPEIS